VEADAIVVEHEIGRARLRAHDAARRRRERGEEAKEGGEARSHHVGHISNCQATMLARKCSKRQISMCLNSVSMYHLRRTHEAQ
jgi:hypothetical protein